MQANPPQLWQVWQFSPSPTTNPPLSHHEIATGSLDKPVTLA
jgi:hypothetical protein